MVSSPKKHQKVDLEKIAAQLASIHILIVPGPENHSIRATAKFATRSFEAGAYRVSVGLKQAILQLDLPSYDIENAYQATLPKETWSESWKNLDSSRVGGGIKARIGASIAGLFQVSAEGHAEKNKTESAEQKASAPYRIVSTTPMGWQIGTELGDPRDPRGTLPKGLDHCLNGEYLSGKSGEHGEGFKEKNGAFALCELRAKPGGNDPRVVATLFGVSGSLQIEITSISVNTSPQARSEKIDRETALRKAFVEICLQRAEAAAKDGIRTDAMLSGEFYLNHHEVRAPMTPTQASEPKAKLANHDIQDTVSKVRADAKRRET
jgi:hypothetical protein